MKKIIVFFLLVIGLFSQAFFAKSNHKSTPKVTVYPTLTSIPTPIVFPVAPDLSTIEEDIENGDYVPCQGKLLNDEIVGKDNTVLIKEDVHWGRLSDICIKPKYFVIHWAGKWININHIKGSLEGNGLSCQFATDAEHLWALMNLYEDRVERAVCSGNKSNFITINNEINGVCFDQAIQGQLVPDSISDQAYTDMSGDVDAICNHFADNKSEGPDTKYPDVRVNYRKKEVDIMTEKAIGNACKVRKIYKIPVKNFIGHFDIPLKYTIHPKYDPGQEYMKIFRKKLSETCPIPEDLL